MTRQESEDRAASLVWQRRRRVRQTMIDGDRVPHRAMSTLRTIGLRGVWHTPSEGDVERSRAMVGSWSLRPCGRQFVREGKESLTAAGAGAGRSEVGNVDAIGCSWRMVDRLRLRVSGFQLQEQANLVGSWSIRVVPQAEIANLMKALWQDVLQEAAHELEAADATDSPARRRPVFPPE